MKTNMTTVARNEADKNQAQTLDWGIRFLVATEIEALRIGYGYKNSPHGYKIEHCPNVGQYSVTVWNDKAKAMGCDV